MNVAAYEANGRASQTGTDRGRAAPISRANLPTKSRNATGSSSTTL